MPGEAPGSASGMRADKRPFWLARSTRTIFFFAAMLTLAGIYLAFQVPISVFPDTNFPRVIIGVDNGVMPVEQMEVTITQPIENAVNSVPGLQSVRSTTSRGSAEVDLFFNWNVDMVQSLQLVDAALAKVQQTLPSTVHITTNRLTFATFPVLGYSLTSDTVSADAVMADRHLRSEASAQSRGRRQHGAGAGRAGAGVSRGAQSGLVASCRSDRHRPGERHQRLEHRAVARPVRSRTMS